MKTFPILLVWAVASSGLGNLQSAERFRPVSEPTQASVSGSGNSFNPEFSADGRHLLFVSQAHNLVTNDSPSPYLGVFVRDLVSSNTVLVSVNASGFGGGNDNCHFPSVSSNGQVVAFASAASNLTPNDTNTQSDVFVRDLNSGLTRLVSIDLSGNSPQPPFSWPPTRTNQFLSGNPILSGDGTLVFFESVATNMVSLEDTNLTTDIFVRNLSANTTTLVSINATGTGAGNSQSGLSSITPDGRLVAFTSRATDLVDGVTNRAQEIYVRDLQLQLTYWASSNALSSSETSAVFYAPVLSGDGHFVYFKKSGVLASNTYDELWRFGVQAQTILSISTNTLANHWPAVSDDGRYAAYTAPDGIYLWDGLNQSNRFVACGDSPSLSADGSIILYKTTQSSCGGSNVVPGIYVQEIASGATHLISQKMDGSPASFVEVALPALSPDGQLVAFESLDDGIVTNDLNQASDIFVRDWAETSTTLISQAHVASPARTGAGLNSLSRNCVSADGRVVVFSSFDSNLAVRDTNQWIDVFAKDVQSGDVIPLSVVPEVIYIDGGSGPGWQTNPPFLPDLNAYAPVISGNGQYAAWVWRSWSGTYWPLTVREDVYVRNLITPTNYGLESRDINNRSSGASSNPFLNSNGTLLVFQSSAPDMVDYITVGTGTNIYLRDLVARTNQLISIDFSGTVSGFSHSIDPQFSPDGQWVLFRSKARNLTTNNVDGSSFIFYARNLNTQKTRLVSPIPSGGSFGLFEPSTAVFSANSRFVFYLEKEYGIFRHDLLEDSTNVLVCEPSYDIWYYNISADANGRWLTYESRGINDAPYPRSIFVKDVQTGQTTLVSVNRFGTGGGDRDSTSPVITGDGRFIMFFSKATNLVDIPVTGLGDIYVRDRLLGTTILATLNRFGTAGGNGKSSQPVLAADGRTVVFQSFASDLVESDYNETQDIFVLRLGGVDSDNDGMDDDWEIAYFGDLSHNGTDDSDSDGRSDLQEFLAGTNPKDGGSVLRVFTLSMPGNSNTTVLWSAVPGRTYQVQFKTNLTDTGWIDLPGSITATSGTGSKVDADAGSNEKRFYRVVWQP